MVQVVVFVFLHRFVGCFQGPAQIARGHFGHLAQQLPVGVVFGFCVHHTFTSHQLGGGGVAPLLGQLHGFDQRLANVLDHPARGRLGVGVQPQGVAQAAHHLLVGQGFLQIAFPFFLQVGVHGAGECGAVHLLAAEFGFHHLQHQIVELLAVVTGFGHGFSFNGLLVG